MNTRRNSRRFRFRAFTSFVILLSTLIIVVGGVFLFISPPGRVANWTDWRLLGLTKVEWESIHVIFATIFIIAGGLHIYYNWRALWGYLKDRVRGGLRLTWELAAATALVLVAFVATLKEVPPVSLILDFGERMEQSWAVAEAEPPVPQPQDLTMEAFGASIGMGSEEMLARLQELGIEERGLQMTVTELAREWGISPRDLSDSIADWRVGDLADIRRPGTGRAGGGAVGGAAGGFGRLTVQVFAAGEGIPLQDALDRLKRAGIDAGPEDNLRVLANTAGKEPSEITAIIRGN